MLLLRPYARLASCRLRKGEHGSLGDPLTLPSSTSQLWNCRPSTGLTSAWKALA